MLQRTGRVMAALGLVVSAWGLVSPATASEDEIFTPSQEQAIDARIRDFILDNPEVIVKALEVLEERQKLAEEQRAREQLAARRDDLLNDPDSPVGWNPEGDVTIVEFFDYQCPYCKAVAPRLADLKNQDGGIRYIYKEWPILGPISQIAARAALASERQGRYEAFHEALITFPGRLKEADIFRLAAKVGLDVDRLKADMNAPEIVHALARTAELAKAVGITGTPAFVIGNNLVPGAAELDHMKSLIEQAREGS